MVRGLHRESGHLWDVQRGKEEDCGPTPNDLNTSRQSPPLEGSTTSQSPMGKRGLTTHIPVTHRYACHSRGS